MSFMDHWGGRGGITRHRHDQALPCELTLSFMVNARTTPGEVSVHGLPTNPRDASRAHATI